MLVKRKAYDSQIFDNDKKIYPEWLHDEYWAYSKKQ